MKKRHGLAIEPARAEVVFSEDLKTSPPALPAGDDPVEGDGLLSAGAELDELDENSDMMV